MPDLRHQVWMITGSSGIGAATARLAAERGVRPFVCGLDATECESLASELGDAEAWASGDLSDPLIANRAVAACVTRFARIDSLFNVAGGSGRRFGDGPVHEISDEGWRQTFSVNLTTMFNVSRAALAPMLEQRAGSILHMATVTAFSPEPERFATHAYAAAKGGAIALTKTMAAYYAPHGIRVNAIAPGLVRTPMSRRAQSDEGIQEFIKHKQPLAHGMIDADEVARAACFLLGEDSRLITGEVLTIDAGWRFSS